MQGATVLVLKTVTHIDIVKKTSGRSNQKTYQERVFYENTWKLRGLRLPLIPDRASGYNQDFGKEQER